VAFQVNYGRRFFSNNKVALYGEINFLASPLRDVSSSVTTATREFSSLYHTPGVRVKFLPASRVSPCVLVGGYADYEQSTTLIDSQPNLLPATPASPRPEPLGARLIWTRGYLISITSEILFFSMAGTVAPGEGKPTGIRTNGRSFFGRPRMLERNPIGLGV
jgi:hypothetical protein